MTVLQPAARNGSTRESPSPSGNVRSSSTSAAGSFVPTLNASATDAATDTRCPALSNKMRMALLTAALSSTTRACAGSRSGIVLRGLIDGDGEKEPTSSPQIALEPDATPV